MRRHDEPKGKIEWEQICYSSSTGVSIAYAVDAEGIAWKRVRRYGPMDIQTTFRRLGSLSEMPVGWSPSNPE